MTNIEEKPLNINEYEELAKKILPKMVYDYYASGANDMITLRETPLAYQRIKLAPRVLRDVSKVNMKQKIFDDLIDFPICISPTAMQRMAYHDGECSTAKAAESMNTIMTLSTLATSSIKQVREAAPNAKLWFQLYVCKNRKNTITLVKKAEQYGYKALCVTVDTPRLGIREADHRNKFHLPEGLEMSNLMDLETSMTEKPKEQESRLNYFVRTEFDPSLTWQDILWLRSITKLKIVVKGVVRYDDARLAAQYGVDGIVVSNHGARQLDTCITTIEALPHVVKGVKSVKGAKTEVFIDGGIRRGTDVLKALALGAKACFIGRPVLWGLAVNGTNGVKHVLQILKDELELAMMLCGCSSLNDISENLIYRPFKAKL